MRYHTKMFRFLLHLQTFCLEVLPVFKPRHPITELPPPRFINFPPPLLAHILTLLIFFTINKIHRHVSLFVSGHPSILHTQA
ncbi:hypothetical protein BJX65DRAFT_143170 [Aspergillus insuetus]